MRRDINKLIKQKALQGDIEFFRSVSLSAFNNSADKVDTGTVSAKQAIDNDSLIECSLDCPEE